jgi:spermidine synthase
MNRRAVIAIFVLSGAAGLIYEVVWSRQLVLVFGNTTQAISAILTGFFGGMAIGSAVGGRIADRVSRPLRLYGVIELVLVPIVLLTPVTFGLIHEVYRAAYPSLEANPTALVLLRFVLSLAALAPATVFMGATLPTLTRYLSRGRTEGLSGAFGWLYAANTIGAIAGTLLAGTVLIEVFGLSETLVVGAGCSALAGLMAILLDRRQAAAAETTIAAPEPRSFEPSIVEPTHDVGQSRVRLALSLAFVSGLTSLAYQVLWTRLVSAGSGNSTYVFTLILATFLLGLAIGSLLYMLLRGHVAPLRLITIGEVLVAILVTLGMVAVIDPHLVTYLDPTTPPDRILDKLVVPTILVVLPPTIALGLILPASSGLVAEADGRIGRHAGQLLAANTIGAICGTFLVPFFVIPAIGSPAAIGVLAVMSAVIAVVVAAEDWRQRPRIGVGSLLGVTGTLVAAVIAGGLVNGSWFQDPTVRRILDGGGHVYEHVEDEIAPVVAGDYGGSPQIWVGGTSVTVITTDTKLMPILPLAARPNARTALVIAFGMGTAYRSSLIAGLQTEAVELVPSVPEMFKWFYPDAAKYADDPEGGIVVADGRNHVDLSNDEHDIVIVDPPPPMETAGVSVITSLEFYEAAQERLNPGGIMVQWVPYQETIDEFRAHVRSFRSVFAHVTIAFGPGHHGTYMLGSDQPIAFDRSNIEAALARPGVVQDLSSAYDGGGRDAIAWASTIASLPWISDADVDRFVGDAPLITDDHPRPEYFLLRRLFGPKSPKASQEALVSLMPQTADSSGFGTRP